MVTLINTNPIGAVDVPLLAKYGRGHLESGEEFDVPRAVADHLLEQVGNYAEKPAAKAAKKTTAAKSDAANTEKAEG